MNDPKSLFNDEMLTTKFHSYTVNITEPLETRIARLEELIELQSYQLDTLTLALADLREYVLRWTGKELGIIE